MGSNPVDYSAKRHALDMVKSDWIMHVTDAGKQDYIQMCINCFSFTHLVNDVDIIDDEDALPHDLADADDEDLVNVDDDDGVDVIYSSEEEV
ncbi:hypothetical protein Tco_1126811 [Tanacetum coccineum]